MDARRTMPAIPSPEDYPGGPLIIAEPPVKALAALVDALESGIEPRIKIAIARAKDVLGR